VSNAGGSPPSPSWEGRLPRGAVTGVGSLPFRDPAEAVELVRRACPEFPFWPQLPRRSSSEVVPLQFLHPAVSWLHSLGGGRLSVAPGGGHRVLDALKRSDGALAAEQAAGFHAFLEALDTGAFATAIAVKAQVTGPLTLGLCIEDRGTPLLYHPGALRVLADYVARQACWQIRCLARDALPVLLVVDEPCLALAADLPGGRGPAVEALASVLDRVRTHGARAGVHCCARVSPAVACEPEPDVLSFDADADLESFLADDAVAALLRRGGWLAAGLVPTRDSPEDSSASALFTRWLMSIRDPDTCVRLARQTLVTASCGLGLATPQAARASFRLAAEVGARLRRIALA
jgi:hypothetical protein